MTAVRASISHTQSRAIQALHFWHTALVTSMHHLSADLSTRQMAILLTVYLDSGPHSVKSLSETLSVSKPAICRGLDVLEQLGLIKRQRDQQDKRNVLVQRTVKGSVYLSEFSDIIVKTSKAM